MHSRTTWGNQGRSSNSKSCARSIRERTLTSDFHIYTSGFARIPWRHGRRESPAFSSAGARVTLQAVTLTPKVTQAPAPDSAIDLGVYVHFPWCLKKCPYCDFLSVAVPEAAPGVTANAAQARAQLPHRPYADAVLCELDRRVARLPHPLPAATSVFFGGGTPSLWEPEELGRVLAAIRGTFDVPHDLEVTVECNPTSVDERHFERLLHAGVNRVSIGVQAVDQERLSFLGRLHDPAGGLEALRTARRAGVPRVSGDLIFGVYKQA